ncbi:MAG: hypothetical protein M3N29_04410 [Chloroflexota bacterium]|nr:hypothetical protein [Chloroflexota bacterium]
MADELLEVPQLCVICTQPLGDSYDDQPDWPNGPICGECYQAQQAEDEMWSSQLNDE